MIAKPELMLASGGIRTIEFRNFAAYGLRVVKPVINIEEKIGKTVGRRVLRDAFRYGMGMQELAVELQKTFRHPRFPKGVFRFHSFEEADAWTMKYLTKRNPN